MERPSDSGETSVTGAKRSAGVPITAGAFAFQLGGTPASKKPRPSAQSVSGKHHHNLSSGLSKPFPTPVPDSGAHTPRKSILQTLDSLPSPLSFQRPLAAPRPGSTSRQRLGTLLDEVSPFRHGTPSRIRKEGGISLSSLPGVEGISKEIQFHKRESEVREIEDEGIGVSPRKVRAKDSKWSGTGNPPIGARLTALLRSNEQSLILFYSSLQRRLSISKVSTTQHRTQSPRQPHDAPNTPEDLVRMATMNLSPFRVIPGPTHQGVLVECEVTKRMAESGKAIRGPADHTRAGDTPGAEDDRNVLEADNAGPGGEVDTDESVLVVLQTLPQACPRIGIEPRLMAGKLEEMTDDTAARWRIGLYSPWTDTRIPLGYADSRPQADEEPDNERGKVYRPPEGSSPIRSKTVIFASRYVVVQVE